jgi:hypothetical protein
MQNTPRFTVLLSLGFAACTGASESETATHLHGSASYRDATTDHAGAPYAAAAPAPQPVDVAIVVRGTGQFPQVDPRCALDPSGAFHARYAGTFALEPDHVYLASFGATHATITTPSGCEIPDLSVGVITDVVVQAHLQATTANCQAYCAAHARAEAEASCGTSAAAAACRANAEADAEAECSASCTTQTQSIAAEVSLAAALFGELDASALRAAALGELEVQLVFDHLIDDQP